MRGVVVPQHGGVEVLSYRVDLPDPLPGKGEVVVQVSWAGMNYIDTLVRKGYPGISIPLPHIPGGDIAGKVVELGEGVDRDWLGRRVIIYPVVWCGDCPLCREGKVNLCLKWRFFGLHIKGGYGERVVVPVQNLIPLPDKMTEREGACLPVAGLTAFHALVTVGNLKPGQVFLTWGGAGGVGTIAIQIAKQIGAQVIGIGSDERRLQLMKDLGCDQVVNRLRQSVVEEVLKNYPYGVDLILDFGGTETFPQSFQMLKRGARLVVCGIITGREVSPFSIHQTYLRHLSILGIYLGVPQELKELVRWVENGWVKPHIGAEFALSEARQAHQALEEGGILGKGLLAVGGE
ncbi:MAG: zinc-binding dehydrogenase [bacterium]